MSKMEITKLLWLDLEMTGLAPETDIILEVAVLVTDLDYNELASYTAVIKPNVDPTSLMDDYVSSMHKNNGLLERLAGGKAEEAVVSELLEFINVNFGQEQPILAGNSIHMDRRFIEKHWPSVVAKLHYRMLDVSSFKILAQSKYDYVYEKQEAHRALGDIHESIAELKFYEEKMGLK